MLFLAMAATLWGMGALLKLPRKGRLAMLIGLWAVVVLAHALRLAPLMQAFGGSLAGWLTLGVAGALVLSYRAVLKALKARALPPQTAPKATFSEVELDRYARHILLREIGGSGQKKLKNAKVLVVGAGGLGAPVLLYLAGAGVGVIGVVDEDIVSNSNLQRQVLYRDQDIGQPKVFAAATALKALNPFIEIRPYRRRFAPELLDGYDLVLDGTDTFKARASINAACMAAGKPLIWGAISQWEGQLSISLPQGPCYACLFPEEPAAGLAPNCAEGGVIGALPGVIGAMMAAEALKYITGAGRALAGRLVIQDLLWGESREIAVKRRADCPCCKGERDDQPAH